MPHGILMTVRGKSSATAAGVNIVPQITEKTENMGAHTRGFRVPRVPTWGPAAPCEAPPSPVRAQGRCPPAEPAGAGGADPGTNFDVAGSDALYPRTAVRNLERTAYPGLRL